MEEWKKTTCVLCGNLCGLEVLVENNRITRIRGDKDNLRSEGYVCRKGLNINHHQHHADRLLYPLKKNGRTFERISWDQAFDEIAEKLAGIIKDHGPRAFALMGGGTLSCISQRPFSVGLLGAMGSKYFYNALAQELTGRYWADGKSFGDQNLHTHPDIEHSNMVLSVGWNPMMSHHYPQARRVLTQFSKAPDKLLVVIDPRHSETAKIADIHLPIRPGTDALLFRGMISIILQEGWENREYIEKHVSGFDQIRPRFVDFKVREALQVCELDYEQVREVCRQFAVRRACYRSDLGVLMSRQSTLISFLENVLLSVTGRIGVKGGNIFQLGLGGGARRRPDSSDKGSQAWRTVVTDFPPIIGLYPPNVMPEEILNDHPDRLRAVIVTGSNPLRSFADTTAYEQAFNKLDLLVTVDIAMTETAALSHYVLPACSAYESFDGSAAYGFPQVFMQFRQPVVKPEGQQIEAAEIFTRLADRLGIIPAIPDSLYQAAESGNRMKFGEALMQYLKDNPSAGSRVPYILAKTLGKKLGSVNQASLWGRMQTLPTPAQERAANAGFTPGPGLGEEIFQAILNHPQGLFVGQVDPETWDYFQALATEDGRINLNVPEMIDWLKEIEPTIEAEKLKENEKQFPLILSAGRHWDVNANTNMRDPVWNQGKRACTLTMHPRDAEKTSLADGQMVRVTTEAGAEVIELEVTDNTRPGYVVMPHGFGLVHNGATYGANSNRLAKNTHRDRLAGTPLHRYIRCKVEAV
jgi:anaerobic selenocysteine-containing dehydrogenase